MNAIKAIPTEYKGYRFRSRLEARWAIFFDACRVKWEYEPEGFELQNGQLYLPDFLLHGCAGRSPSDMYVEVKGKMTEADAEKILQFSGIKDFESNEIMHPILVVAGIPDGDCIADIEDFCQDLGYNGFPEIKHRPYPFNFETIDGDYFVAIPVSTKKVNSSCLVTTAITPMTVMTQQPFALISWHGKLDLNTARHRILQTEGDNYNA